MSEAPWNPWKRVSGSNDFALCTPTYGPTVVGRQRLDIGDVCLRTEGSTLLIERKTWDDWAASICDGRYKNQKSRSSTPMTRPRSPCRTRCSRWAYSPSAPSSSRAGREHTGKNNNIFYKLCHEGLLPILLAAVNAPPNGALSFLV